MLNGVNFHEKETCCPHYLPNPYIVGKFNVVVLANNTAAVVSKVTGLDLV